MAIRKPVLSVKEARSLAAHRTDLVPGEHPHVQLVPAVQPEPDEVSPVGAFHDTLQEPAPSPVTETDADLQPEPEVAVAPAVADAVLDHEVMENVAQEPPMEAESKAVEFVAAAEAEVLPAAPINEHASAEDAPMSPEPETGLRRKASEKKSRKAVAENAPPVAKRQKQTVIGKRSEEGKIQVFLSAALPARNVSKSFEVLCRQYAPAKSLQMILRRALDDYEVLLENGELDSLPEGYIEAAAPDACGIIQTSRIMPVQLIEKARAHFDPLGFESDRAFGRKLASAALAIFFEIQAQHQ